MKRPIAANRIKHWVLQNSKGFYFKEWTDIGPRATRDRSEAEKFRTRGAAMQSQAYSFALETYEPKPVRYR